MLSPFLTNWRFKDTKGLAIQKISAAPKGYAEGTENPRVGADRDLATFMTEFKERMAEFSLRLPNPGTWHLQQGMRIYIHVRDRVFPKPQKFNKALSHIYACNPTGVTDQQKCNMAVAIYTCWVKIRDYDFNDFDEIMCKL